MAQKSDAVSAVAQYKMARGHPRHLRCPAGRGIQLVLLTAAVSASLYAGATVGPLQETMRIALALSDNQMALLQGPTAALPCLIAAAPLGLVVDRYSRVRLLFVFALLNVAGSFGTALTSNFTLIFVARCVVQLAGYGVLIAAYSLMADLYAPAQRGRANMVMAIGGVGGLSAAFALGGALVAISGGGPTAWQRAMLWLSCPLVAVLLLMAAMREPPRTGVAIKSPSTRQSFSELWRYRAVLAPLLGGLVFIVMAYGAAYIWAAPVLSRTFALSPDRIGAIVGVILLANGVLGSLTGGVLADLCQRAGGPRRTASVLSALAVLSVPFGLFAVAPGVASASISLVFLLTTTTAITLMVTTMFTVVLPNELWGLGTAMLNAAATLFCNGLAPLVVSLLSGAIGGPATIGKAVSIVCVVTCVFGAAIFGLGRRHVSCTAVQ